MQIQIYARKKIKNFFLQRYYAHFELNCDLYPNKSWNTWMRIKINLCVIMDGCTQTQFIVDFSTAFDTTWRRDRPKLLIFFSILLIISENSSATFFSSSDKYVLRLKSFCKNIHDDWRFMTVIIFIKYYY